VLFDDGLEGGGGEFAGSVDLALGDDAEVFGDQVRDHALDDEEADEDGDAADQDGVAEEAGEREVGAAAGGLLAEPSGFGGCFT
jgi:hypothetical protein